MSQQAVNIEWHDDSAKKSSTGIILGDFINIRRTLCIKLEREQNEKDVFITAVASALREYAVALEETAADDSFTNKNGAGSDDIESFTATNGCKLKTTHKVESINLKP